MRSIGSRLSLLLNLVTLRCGPGSAILPKEVTRIHMDFACKIHGGHMGARKFWREYLPRLKYHNPAVPMIVNRHDKNENPPVMTIYFRTTAEPSSGSIAADESTVQLTSSRTNLSKAQPPGPDERIVHIDMQLKQSSVILDHFLAETQAKVLQPTEDDIAEMQGLQILKERAAVNRERVRLEREEKKKEWDMIKRAREAGGVREQDAT